MIATHAAMVPSGTHSQAPGGSAVCDSGVACAGRARRPAKRMHGLWHLHLHTVLGGRTPVLQHAAMRSTYSLAGGSSLGGVIVSCAWVAASLEGGRSEGEISSRALRSEIDLLKLISCSSSTRTSHIFQTEVINLQQAPDRDLITLGGIKGHPHVTTLFSPRPSRTTQAVA